MKIKKIAILALALIMIFALIGCRQDEPQDRGQSAPPPASDQGSDNETSDPATPDNDDVAVDDAPKESTQIDGHLEGMELLATITYTMPNAYRTQSRVVMNDMTMNMVTYVKGDHFRYESDDPITGVQTINIFNADQEVTYYFKEGESVGSMYNEAGMDDYDDELDWDEITLAELVAEDGDEFVTAQMVDLDGRPAVYIEMMYDYGDGSKEISRYWYSPTYPIMYRFEAISDGVIMYLAETLDYEINPNLSDSLFLPPDGIEWERFFFDD